MSLYISSATASSELKDSAINQAISRLAMSVAMAKQQGGIPAGPSLDVTFMLPGQFEKPDFTGMRMGGYSDESDTLYFERSVPEYIIHSDMAKQYVAVVMQDVVDHAGEFFQAGGHEFDTARWQQLVQLISDADVSLTQ